MAIRWPGQPAQAAFGEESADRGAPHRLVLGTQDGLGAKRRAEVGAVAGLFLKLCQALLQVADAGRALDDTAGVAGRGWAVLRGEGGARPVVEVLRGDDHGVAGLVSEVLAPAGGAPDGDVLGERVEDRFGERLR